MEVTIQSVSSTMTYDKAITVPTGVEIHLVLENRSALPAMAHNWVLVKPGTEASVAAAGLKSGESAGYIDVADKSVLERTPLAQPGASAEVTFTAPAPGTYPYICTVPGHYIMMKGVLTVTP
jgi:azurin